MEMIDILCVIYAYLIGVTIVADLAGAFNKEDKVKEKPMEWIFISLSWIALFLIGVNAIVMKIKKMGD